MIEILKNKFEHNYMPEPNTGCWIWIAASSNFGYGIIANGRTTIGAHRVSYMIYKGIIPKGVLVCHTCDNAYCVNPEHLFLGTQIDNMRDKMAKGRHVARKSECNLSKLTKESVLQIRELSKSGLNNNQISKIVGTSRANISHVVRRLTWKNI